jgi:hypothetical protein
MELQYRRVRVPLRGVWADGQKGIVTLPKRAILRVAAGSIDDDPGKVVPAFVGDRKILFYSQDLKERTAIIKNHSAMSCLGF